MMKTVSFAVASLLTSTKAQTPEQPLPDSKTGNFFYMLAKAGGNAPGINGYDVTIGMDAAGNGQLISNVAISASEQLFRVVDSTNTDWAAVPTKYTQASSITSLPATTGKNVPKPIDTTDDILSVTATSPSAFMDATVNTSFFYDDVKLSITDFDRSIYLKGFGMGAITGLVTPDPPIDIPFFNGWMGIAPYQSMDVSM